MMFQFKKSFSFQSGVDSTFLNPYSYLMARKQESVYDEFNLYVDGEWLRKFLNLFGKQNVDRVSFDFTSIADDLFKLAQEKQLSITVVGSTEEHNYAFVQFLKKNYPKLKLANCRSGFFSSDVEKQRYLELINQENTDIVIVGMGAPIQEQFLLSLRKLGWKGTGFTCGGFIHQTAGAQGNYYPEFFNKFNLRFLYRMYDEPKLIKRYFFDYPRFVFYFFKDLYKG